MTKNVDNDKMCGAPGAVHQNITLAVRYANNGKAACRSSLKRSGADFLRECLQRSLFRSLLYIASDVP